MKEAEPTHYVYALECRNGSVYIGQTKDVRNRWKLHSTGKGADWTKRHPPVRPFYLECVQTLRDAFLRENELKTSAGRYRLKKILAETTAECAVETAEETLERLIKDVGSSESKAKKAMKVKPPKSKAGTHPSRMNKSGKPKVIQTKAELDKRTAAKPEIKPKSALPKKVKSKPESVRKTAPEKRVTRK